MRIAACIVTTLCLATCVFVRAQQSSALAGDWTGESLCFGNNPSCHDEKVVYHISIDSSDATKVKIAADKIVDGKPVSMGDVYLKYDSEKRTLTGDFQTPRYRGVWEFVVKGNVIEGGLYLLPDRATGRKIRVQKNESNQKESLMTGHADAP